MNPTAPNGRGEGRKRRDRAVSALERRRQFLIRRFQILFLSRLLHGERLTSDAGRSMITIPSTVRANFLGSAVLSLARWGLIRRCGDEASTLPQCHARRLPRWEVADAPKARRWLVDHPPLPEVPENSLFSPKDFDPPPAWHGGKA